MFRSLASLSRFKKQLSNKYLSPAKHFLKDLIQHNSNHLQHDYVGPLPQLAKLEVSGIFVTLQIDVRDEKPDVTEM